MRAFGLFLLCVNTVHSIDRRRRNEICSLKSNQTLEDAIGVCKKPGYFTFRKEGIDIDFSNFSNEAMKLPRGKGRFRFLTKLGNVKMVANSHAKLLEVTGPKVLHLEIRRNKNMTAFQPGFREIKSMRISGNPQLEKLYIELIHHRTAGSIKSNDSYIQEQGECEYEESVKNVDELEFCKYVEGDLIMENTVGTNVDSKLHKITGCLQIINTELKNIDFLHRIRSINDTCKSGKKSIISGNKKLRIHFFEKEKLKNEHNIDVQEHPLAVGICSPVEVLTKGLECVEVSGDLNIIGKGVSLHNLKTIRLVKGSIKIEKTDVDSLHFPELTSIGKPGHSEPVLMVSDNPHLTSLQLPKLQKTRTTAETLIVIRGNKKFNSADMFHKQFSKLDPKKILDIECNPDKIITKLSQLNGCSRVSGDLVLKGTSGESSTKLTHIHGCLKVVDTSLKDLSFLNLDEAPVCATESEISGNKDLCLSWSSIQLLEKKIGKITYKADGACETVCDFYQFETFDACNVLDGDLTVIRFGSNDGPGTTLPKILAKVRKITGRLVISGNKSPSIVFPELASIGNPKSFTREAILIDRNVNLKEISIPKLRTVETGGSVAVVVKRYKMTKDQAKLMKHVAGGKQFKLECDFSNDEVKDFGELDYCTSVKGDLLLKNIKNTHGVLNTKIESIGGCLQIIDTNLDKNTFYSLVSPLQSEKCQSGEKSEIKGNKNLCFVWSEIKDVKINFMNPVEFSFDESCELPCTEQEFEVVGSYCKTFYGHLEIDESKELNDAKAIFQKVKRIKGRISIRNTSLEEIKFTQLTVIENLDKDSYALHLYGNNALRKFLMPRLKKVVSTKTTPVMIEENDGFRISKELIASLQSAMMPGHTFDYYCHESSEISDFARIEGCKKMSSGVHFKGKVSGNVPQLKLSEIRGCLEVEDTDLSSLDFLSSKIDGDIHILQLESTTGSECKTEHFIWNNENLCISPLLERQLRQFLPKITISNNKPRDQCPVLCTAENGKIPDRECNIVKGELRIEGNCAFDQNLAFVEQIDGGLVIQNCYLSSLKDVLPKLRNISSSGIPLVLENVEKYSNLVDLVQFELESDIPDGILIKINTNQEIPYMVDADLKAHFGSKRVEVPKVKQIPEGVCVFVDPTVEVNNCNTVEGDLVLDETSVSVSTEVTEITGCLVVKNTNMEHYEFLTKIEKIGDKCRWTGRKAGISNNTCIPYDVRRRTSGKIKELVESEENKKRCYECIGGIVPGQKCKVIIGSLEINETSQPQITNQLEEVEKIYGRLIIKNSSLPQIILSQLSKIYAKESKEEAILIDGNENLQEISIPKLATVQTGGNVAVVVKGYKMTKDQAKFMKNLAGGKEFKLECDFSNKEVKDFAELDYCTSVKGDLLLKNTRGVLNTKIESIGGCLQIIDTDVDKNAFYSLVSPLESGKCQSGEKSEIKGNKNLCFVWSEIKDIHGKFGKAVQFSFDESCELLCTEKEFSEEGSYCKTFYGHLEFDERNEVNAAKAVFQKVETIKGRISISNTSLEGIEFTQLTVIENLDKDSYTLHLYGNNALRKFLMPRLKEIVSTKTTPVMIEGNDGFRISNEFIASLQSAMMPGHTFDYYCHESSEISDFERLEGCTKMSSDVYLNGKIRGNLPKSKLYYIRGCMQVENTDLSSLDFLKVEETTGGLELDNLTGSECKKGHFIRNNKDLCISPLLERQLKEMHPKVTISGNKPRDQCPVFCTAVGGKVPDHECNIVQGELKIETDCSFDHNLAHVEQIRGGLVVKDCSLSSLKVILPKLTNIASSGVPLVLENVENYSNLTDLRQFKLESQKPDGVLIEIAPNQEIPYMIAADLKSHFGSNRIEVSKVEQVPDGVCVFVDPAVEVKNCKTVEGDLVLNEKSVSVSTDLTEITGCLVVKDTNMENYDFLTKIEKIVDKCRWNDSKTGISNNSCIPYDIRRKTSGKIKELVESEENNKGCHECSGQVLHGQECRVIIGDLEINQASLPEMTNQLESVKEIYGRLIIKNTNLSQITLTQLTKIDATESEEPAIEITGNDELSLLQMPSLVNVSSNGKVLVKIEENKKLKKTAELMEVLEKATGSQCREEKEGICLFSEVREPQKAALTASKEKEKTVEEEGVSKTVFVVIAIITGNLLVVITATVAMITMLIKKKRDNKTKKGLETGKSPSSTKSTIENRKPPIGNDKSSTKSLAVLEKTNVSEKPEDAKQMIDQKKEGNAPGIVVQMITQ